MSAKRLVAGDSVLFIWLETFLQIWLFVNDNDTCESWN